MKFISSVFIFSYCFLFLGFSQKTETYHVHFIPFFVQFYAPPTPSQMRQNGIYFDMESEQLDSFFEAVVTDEMAGEPHNGSINPRVWVLQKSSGEEIFIEYKKSIVSLAENKRYKIDRKLEEKIFNEIEAQMKKHPLYRCYKNPNLPECEVKHANRHRH